MNITEDMTVYVYTFPRSEFLKSAHSNFEVLIEDNPLVAYSEELKYLFQSVEAYHYSTANYIKDSLYCSMQEMTYIEYVRKYKDILNKKHADAPVLNLTEDTELPTDPFSRLVKLGVRFS